MFDSYRVWASYYDAMTDPALTKREMAFFQWAFRKYSIGKVRSVLDVTCGTGRHAIPLAKKRYSVTAQDISQEMLAVAKEKAKKMSLDIDFRLIDMRRLQYTKEFDAVISINSAFNYMRSDEDAEKAIKGFYRALKPGGIAIVDVMNFVRLIGDYKPTIKRSGEGGGIRFRSIARFGMESLPAIWVHEQLDTVWKGGKVFKNREVHRLRMFNYNEMKRFFVDADFREVRCFGDFDDRREAKKNAKRLIFVCVK